jgi:transposase InsO family protein
MREFGIEVVVNPPHTPQHNGKIERYHKTMKREFMYRYTTWDMPIPEINYRY